MGLRFAATLHVRVAQTPWHPIKPDQDQYFSATSVGSTTITSAAAAFQVQILSSNFELVLTSAPSNLPLRHACWPSIFIQ